MSNLISTKNRVFITLVDPSERGKSQLIYNCLKIETFEPKTDKIYFFYQHSQPLYDGMQKDTENVEIFQSVTFDFIEWLKNNDTNSLSICQSLTIHVKRCAILKRLLILLLLEDIVDWALIKHNLFHQSKFGRDVELQNTHIVPFKSPRDLMQVSTLSAQLGLGAELVDWYRDATSVPYSNFLIDLSPRTDDPLRYCRNTGSIPWKFFSRTDWVTQNIWTMETQNLATLQMFKSISHKCKVFSFSPAQKNLWGSFANVW